MTTGYTFKQTRIMEVGVSITLDQMPYSLVFLSDTQDVEPIAEEFKTGDKYQSFFVETDGEGGYLQVWGMAGIVPYLDKYAKKVR